MKDPKGQGLNLKILKVSQRRKCVHLFILWEPHFLSGPLWSHVSRAGVTLCGYLEKLWIIVRLDKVKIASCISHIQHMCICLFRVCSSDPWVASIIDAISFLHQVIFWCKIWMLQHQRRDNFTLIWDLFIPCLASPCLLFLQNIPSLLSPPPSSRLQITANHQM